MSSWSISPTNGVTNLNNGTFNFADNTGSSRNYTITFTDDNGCSASVLYTLQGGCQTATCTPSLSVSESDCFNVSVTGMYNGYVQTCSGDSIYITGTSIGNDCSYSPVTITITSGEASAFTQTSLTYTGTSFTARYRFNGHYPSNSSEFNFAFTATNAAGATANGTLTMCKIEVDLAADLCDADGNIIAYTGATNSSGLGIYVRVTRVDGDYKTSIYMDTPISISALFSDSVTPNTTYFVITGNTCGVNCYVPANSLKTSISTGVFTSQYDILPASSIKSICYNGSEQCDTQPFSEYKVGGTRFHDFKKIITTAETGLYKLNWVINGFKEE